MISVVIITYNEERIIARCLEAVKSIADEILIVDSFSSDKTVEICKQNGAKVIQRKFDGYRSQKDFACKSSKHLWILSLDADEVLSKELILSLKRWKNKMSKSEDFHPSQSQPVGYFINRITEYCGKWVRHGGWYPDRKLRFYHRDFGHWSGRNVHEFVEIKSGFSTNRLKGDLLHFSINEPADLLRKLYTYSELGARYMSKEGRRTTTLEAISRSAFRYLRQTVFQFGFLDGRLGLKLAKENARSTYWKYRRLKAINESKYNRILLIAKSCSTQALIIKKAIYWFKPDAEVIIHSKGRLKDAISDNLNTLDAIVVMDDIVDGNDIAFAEGSTLIVKEKRSNTKMILPHSLGMLHSLDFPASLRFPEKKDWERLSQS